MLKKQVLFRFLLVALVLCASAVLRAQDVATLTGEVTDTSGAAIPGAQVELVNTKTSASYKATTNGAGSYTLTGLPPAAGYKLTISREGFKSEVISDLYLTVENVRTQNVKLSAGGSTQTVEVSASNENVTLDTTDASIGNNLSVEQLNELPVYDRTAGITTLFVQQPGVDSFQGAVTGARIDQSEVTVDGLDANDIASGQTFAIVATAPVDSVEQFTGTVAGLVSAVGTGSGAQFQLVTKSGTNQFHGNVNEYHRDTTTVANEWFNNLTGLPRTPLIRNQFGGNIGGPVKRDKLFFFFDFADSRIIQSSTAEPTVPLDAFRNGQLNYINSGAGCGDSSRISTQPQCITTLTAGQIAALDPAGIGFNPNVQALITSRYPQANDLSRGDGVNTGGYRFTYPTPDLDTTYVTRMDYQLTSKQRVSGRFTINRRNAVESLPEFPTDPSTHPFIDRSYAYVISHTWTLGSNKVNQFYYGDNISKFDFPDLYNPTGADQYSFSGLSGPYTGFDGQKRRVPIPVVRDDFNWQIGAHSLTFGGTFKFIKTNSNLINNFNFVGAGLQGAALQGGLTTKPPEKSLRPADINQGSQNVAINDYDSLFASALGVIGDISTNFVYNNKGAEQALGGGAPRAYRYYQTEAYVGDTWKIRKDLTLSYGVRYQYYSVPYEAHGDESVPTAINLNTFINDRLVQSAAGDSSNTGLPIYAYVLGGKVNHGPDLYKPSYKDFAPRVAFAWTPYGSGKTVIDGGASIVYDRSVINAINFLQDQVPNIFANSVTNQFGGADARASLIADPRLGASLAYSSSLNPTPAPATVPSIPYVDGNGVPYGLAEGQTGFEISPNLKDPYSIQLNFGVQQEFPAHIIMKLNYVGRLGRRLLADADANQVIDVPDYTGKSQQTMAQAFAGLTTDERANVALRPEPWFENVMAPYGAAFGYGDNTNLVATLVGQLGSRGDISDMLQALAFYTYYEGLTGFLPTNIGIPSQFGTNAYLTNMGSSNYHGLLLTVDKNLSQGLQFEMNYTWSHSIDNTSLSSNANSLFSNSGFICDILRPRACRGSSDFDVRQELTSNFLYALPLGRGKQFAGTAPRWADEAIGGWSISGVPSYRTGLAVTPYSDAYLASFDNADPAIFTGKSTSELKTKVNVDHASQTVYAFAGGLDGANKVLADFRGPIGLEYGQRNLVRGPGAFYFDAGLGKTFPIYEDKINLKFRADAFNVLNHPVFGTQAMNIVTNASNFGQITGTTTGLGQSSGNGGARVAQFSLRLEF